MPETQPVGTSTTEVATTEFVRQELVESAKGFVDHGAVASTPRPDYASVEWFGTVEPDNWIDGDTWIDPS